MLCFKWKTLLTYITILPISWPFPFISFLWIARSRRTWTETCLVFVEQDPEQITDYLISHFTEEEVSRGRAEPLDLSHQ